MSLKSTRAATVGLVLVVATVNCSIDRGSGGPPAEDTSAKPAALTAVSPGPGPVGRLTILAPEPSENPIPGFRHNLARSRFAIGSHVSNDEDSAGVRRWIGTHGIFVDYQNGFSSGIPNGAVPALDVGPFSTDAAVHSARVKSYFVGAGIPTEQLGPVEINTWMREGGHTIKDSMGRVVETVAEFRELIGFVSIVTRVIEGVRVADSFAWAMFNRDDEVAYEQVWWPELGRALVEEIAHFRGALASGQFRGKLDDGGEPGHLAIHHSTPSGERWYAQVTYDVSRGSQVLHFDRSGAPVSLVSWSVGDTGGPRIDGNRDGGPE